MITHVELPNWLDDFIFIKLNANYCRSNSDMTVIDWNKDDVLNYLGTYFPRSYTESYCIFQNILLQNCAKWTNKEELSVFDLGCGTGGEIIGFLTALEESKQNYRSVTIHAFDGNQNALRILEHIIDRFNEQSLIHAHCRPLPFTIEDFYDMSILNKILTNKIDIFITFKAICEFASKERFEETNPYAHIVKTFLPKLSPDGIMVLEDVTTYNNVSQEWLPKMMDAGITEAKANLLCKNENYNQVFSVSHSRRKNDISKVAWRIINNK